MIEKKLIPIIYSIKFVNNDLCNFFSLLCVHGRSTTTRLCTLTFDIVCLFNCGFSSSSFSFVLQIQYSHMSGKRREKNKNKRKKQDFQRIFPRTMRLQLHFDWSAVTRLGGSRSRHWKHLETSGFLHLVAAVGSQAQLSFSISITNI